MQGKQPQPSSTQVSTGASAAVSVTALSAAVSVTVLSAAALSVATLSVATLVSAGTPVSTSPTGSGGFELAQADAVPTITIA